MYCIITTIIVICGISYKNKNIDSHHLVGTRLLNLTYPITQNLVT